MVMFIPNDPRVVCQDSNLGLSLFVRGICSAAILQCITSRFASDIKGEATP